MTLTPATCVIATCDTCGEAITRDDQTQHFADPDEALSVAEDTGWVIGQAGGALTCGSCVESVEHRLTGCTEWSAWLDIERDDYTGRIRCCLRCRRQEGIPPIPAHLLPTASPTL